jgi:hypothetical protein
MNAKHRAMSPTPWRIDGTNNELWINDADGYPVCMVSASDIIIQRDRIDASLIVRAVNSHADMLAALCYAEAALSSEYETRGEEDSNYPVPIGPALRAVNAAIALAERAKAAP